MSCGCGASTSRSHRNGRRVRRRPSRLQSLQTRVRAYRERAPVLRVAARLGERCAPVDFRAVVFLGDRRAVVFLAVIFLAADRFVVVVVLAAPLRLVDREAVVLRVVVFAVEDFFLGERLADALRPVVDCFAEDFLVVRFAAPLRFVERRAALVDRAAFLVPPADRFFAPVVVRAAMEHGSFVTFSTPFHDEAPNVEEHSSKGLSVENVRRFADRLTTETVSVAGHCCVLKQVHHRFVKSNVENMLK